MDPLWVTLPVKMAASAAIVVSASIAVERSGPLIGALIATLPISAGPAYVFLSLDHGPAFIAESAQASLLACAATAPFVALYAHLAQRRGLLLCLACGLAGWLGFTAVANSFTWTLPAAIGLNIIAYGASLWLTRGYLHAAARRGFVRRWWDLPLRAATVMSVAATVVLAGRVLGPTTAGILALLPVVLTSLAIVLQPRIGGPATAAVMAHGLPGMVGFTLGVLSLHLLAVPLGTAAALSVALAICVGWNIGLFALRRRGAAREATP